MDGGAHASLWTLPVKFCYSCLTDEAALLHQVDTPLDTAERTTWLLQSSLKAMARTRIPERLCDPERMWCRFQIYVLGSMS